MWLREWQQLAESALGSPHRKQIGSSGQTAQLCSITFGVICGAASNKFKFFVLFGCHLFTLMNMKSSTSPLILFKLSKTFTVNRLIKIIAVSVANIWEWWRLFIIINCSNLERSRSCNYHQEVRTVWRPPSYRHAQLLSMQKWLRSAQL